MYRILIMCQELFISSVSSANLIPSPPNLPHLLSPPGPSSMPLLWPTISSAPIISFWDIPFTLLPYVKYVCALRVMYPPQPDRGGNFSHLSHNSRRLVGETGFLPSIAAPLPFANIYVLWNTLPASWSLIAVIYQHSSLSNIAPLSLSLCLCHCLSSFLEMSKYRWLTHPAFRALSVSTLTLHMNFLSTYLSHLSS